MNKEKVFWVIGIGVIVLGIIVLSIAYFIFSSAVNSVN